MIQPLRAALVGCGGISRAWLSAIAGMPDLALVGLVDLNAALAEQRAQEYGLSAALTGDDLESILTRTEADLVFNCTVPAAHREVTLTALRSGCHVLGEKPLAETLDQAREMIAAAEAADKLFAVIQNRRYDAQIRRVQTLLRSGALGRLTTINSDFYIGAHFGGFRDQMAHVLLLDMAIHTFDAARMLAQADPVAVYCHEWNPSGSWYARDASAVAIFEFAGGLIYTYRGSWCAEGLPTSWESDWRIIGERGSVRWDGGAQLQAQVVEPTPGRFSLPTRELEPPPLDREYLGGHAGQIHEFVACVRSGRQPETIAADNIKSLAMTLAAIESAERGQRVAVAW
jgi:predicted dehydrogenase